MTDKTALLMELEKERLVQIIGNLQLDLAATQKELEGVRGIVGADIPERLMLDTLRAWFQVRP